MKDRIVIPLELRFRIERLVRARAKVAKTTEEDARREICAAIIARGIASLELAADLEGDPA